MITIQTNSICIQEKKYIFDQIFDLFLGIAFKLQINEEINSIRLHKNNKVIEINSQFFQSFNRLEWLSKKSLPKTPLRHLSRDKLGFLKTKLNFLESVPIIFGSDEIDYSEDKIYLGLDIFGSCFFMLSRYEEVVVEAKDTHGRFLAKASLAFQENFLERPIVDEYVEVLWGCIHFLFSNLIRKSFVSKTYVSCDVDYITDKGVRFPGIFKRLGGDLIKRKSLKSFFISLNTFFKVFIVGKKELDPFNTFDFMMDICDNQGLKMAFYFIPRNNKQPIDGNYDIQSIEVIDLMKKIMNRGHEVGYHASYYSYKDGKKTREEVKLLKKVYEEAGGNSEDIIGGRQHFLRWETGITENNWEHSEMKYDTTLGYAEQIGYRCGTSKEYNFYNLLKRKNMNLLLIRPLLIMDCTLLSPQYMGLNIKESVEAITRIKNTVKKHQGNFTILWHNSYLESNHKRKVFEFALKNKL
jgi:hypothetical protein